MKPQDNYIPSGTLQGDDKAMPDRGTSTGMNGDTYGADLSVDATNRIGSVGEDASQSTFKDTVYPGKTYGVSSIGGETA